MVARRASAAVSEWATARTSSGARGWAGRGTRHAGRRASMLVLPDPAPPMTISGPPLCSTARCCSGDTLQGYAAMSALEADWLGAARRAGEGLRAVLADNPTTKERLRETGTTGGGGDDTLYIDRWAEDAVFAELDRLHAEGHRFCAVSEERGLVDYGDPAIRVVID